MLAVERATSDAETVVPQGMTTPAASRPRARHASLRAAQPDSKSRTPATPRSGAQTERRTSSCRVLPANITAAELSNRGTARGPVRRNSSITIERSSSMGNNLNRLSGDDSSDKPATPRDGRGQPTREHAAPPETPRSPVPSRMRTPRTSRSSPLSRSEQRSMRTSAPRGDQSGAATPRSLLSKGLPYRATAPSAGTPRGAAGDTVRGPRRRTSLSIDVQAGIGRQGARVTRSVPVTPQTELVEHRCSTAVTSSREAAGADAQWLDADSTDATPSGHAATELTPESLLTGTSGIISKPSAVQAPMLEPHQLQSSGGQRAILLETRSTQPVPAARTHEVPGNEACAPLVPQQPAVPGTSLLGFEPPTPSPQPHSHIRASCSSLPAQQPLTPAHVLRVRMRLIPDKSLPLIAACCASSLKLNVRDSLHASAGARI